MSGQEIVRQIENLPVDRNSRPLEEPTVRACGELVKQVKGEALKHINSTFEVILTKSVGNSAKKEKKKKKSAAKSASDSDSNDSSSSNKKKKKEKSKKKSKKSSKEK